MRKLTLSVLARTLMVASVTGIFAGTATADTNADITVTATVPANVSTVDYRDSQNQGLKQALSTNFDVSIVQSQRTRDGIGSINLRGLQGNRVALTLDGVNLAEGQETRFFAIRLKGLDFGRGSFIEPTSLVSVLVDTNAGGKSLSGSVNFKTINPEDILKGKTNAGYFLTSYNSVNNAFTGSSAYAFKSGAYQGMVLGTYRNYHEQKNAAGKSAYDVVGENRLAPNPQDNKTAYFLTKHFYQLNESNKLGFTLELVRNQNNTNELNVVGTTDRRLGTTNQYSFDKDKSSRIRIDLSNEYESDGLVWNSKFTYQNNTTVNRQTNGYLKAASTRGASGSSSSSSTATTPTAGTETKRGGYSYRAFTLNNQVKKDLELAGLQHQLELVADLSYAISDFDIKINDSLSGFKHFKVMPKASEFTGLLRLTDRIVVSDYNLVVKPQLSLLYSGISVSNSGGYKQTGGSWTEISGKSKFRVLPGLYLEKVVNRNFRPYFNYSRGVRIPSVQLYYTSFDRGVRTVRGSNQTEHQFAVGNQFLKVESSNNFELGVTGGNENLAYKVAGFINKYNNFITNKIYQQLETVDGVPYTYFSYANLRKQTIMGVQANLRFNIGNGWKASTAIQYTDGTFKEEGKEYHVSKVDPLRWMLGLNYDASNWGAAITGTYTGAKTDAQLRLESGAFNPANAAFIVDTSVYYKPTDYLTLNAGINNLFNKAYVNWSSIAYYFSDFARENRTVSDVTQANWLGYTEPGRNYFISAKFNF